MTDLRNDRRVADGYEGAGIPAPSGTPRRQIWVQHVAVETDKLQMRVDAARARGNLTASQEVIADGVCGFIRKARAAAFRDDPIPGSWANWWRGTLVEAAYRNMHTARAQMIDLYEKEELRAEIPMVVARANATMHRDDPRLITVPDLEAEPVECLRPRMRRVVGDTYENLDLKHAQLRSFRNILLMAATFIALGVIATLVFVSQNPHLMPLCFPRQVISSTDPALTIVTGMACPTSSGSQASPSSADILIVAVLGALGGALAATLSIRNLKGTSTPDDVPVALASLKVPLGADRHIGPDRYTGQLRPGVVWSWTRKGRFWPILSSLDSPSRCCPWRWTSGRRRSWRGCQEARPPNQHHLAQASWYVLRNRHKDGWASKYLRGQNYRISLTEACASRIGVPPSKPTNTGPRTGIREMRRQASTNT